MNEEEKILKFINEEYGNYDNYVRDLLDLYNKEKEKNNKIYNFCRRELAFEKRLKREKRKPDEFNQGRFYVCENIKEILTNKVEEDIKE